MTDTKTAYEWERDQARDVSAFVQGQQDCREGVPHQSGKGESYRLGYDFQYQLEAILSAEPEAPND